MIFSPLQREEHALTRKNEQDECRFSCKGDGTLLEDLVAIIRSLIPFPVVSTAMQFQMLR